MKTKEGFLRTIAFPLLYDNETIHWANVSEKDKGDLYSAMQAYADQQSASDKKLIESLNTDLGIMNDNLLKAVEERDRYKEALELVRVDITSDYDAQCNDADWYNNNMPCVGQNLDYKSRPLKPKALEIIDNALTPHP